MDSQGKKKKKEKSPRLTNPQGWQFKEAILFILYTSFLVADKSLLYTRQVMNCIQHPIEKRQLLF